MLKQVALTEVEMGMFVHKMVGSWFDHPFWRSKFLIEDADRLRTLRESSLDGVIIDTARGKDVAPPQSARGDNGKQAAAARPEGKGRINAIRSRKSVEARPPAPVSTAQEMQAAQAIVSTGRNSVHKAFLAARLGKALNVRAVEPVVRDIHASLQRNPQAFSGLMRCKLNNEFAYRHALAVSALMVSLARKMALPPEEIFQAGIAGLFLDIGTNYLPRELVPADGDYRTLDQQIWQQHVILGHRALQNDESFARPVLDACLEHHERMDGTGFPGGLGGQDISQFGRMAAICDTFDFLLTDSAGGEALDPAAAIQRLTEMEGAFDDEILRKFIESVGLYPVGSFVQLRSNRLAMVIDEDKQDSTRPVVQAFYSLSRQQRITPRRVALAHCDDEDEIIGIADLSGLGLPPDPQLRELIFLGAHQFEQ